MKKITKNDAASIFIGARITKADAEMLDQLVKSGRYMGRSDAIRDLIRKAKNEHLKTKKPEA